MIFQRLRKLGDGLDMRDKGTRGFKNNSQVPITEMGKTGRRMIWEKEFYFRNVRSIQIMSIQITEWQYQAGNWIMHLELKQEV